jgi:transcriptional regulator with XRE-family HTH domain
MTSTPSAVFRRRLRELREQHGLSQAQLAARVSTQGGAMSQTTVTRLERGPREVTLSELFALARALNTSPVGLLVENHFGAVRVGDYDTHVNTVADWLLGNRPLESDGDQAAFLAALPDVVRANRGMVRAYLLDFDLKQLEACPPTHETVRKARGAMVERGLRPPDPSLSPEHQIGAMLDALRWELEKVEHDAALAAYGLQELVSDQAAANVTDDGSEHLAPDPTQSGSGSSIEESR